MTIQCRSIPKRKTWSPRRRRTSDASYICRNRSSYSESAEYKRDLFVVGGKTIGRLQMYRFRFCSTSNWQCICVVFIKFDKRLNKNTKTNIRSTLLYWLSIVVPTRRIAFFTSFVLLLETVRNILFGFWAAVKRSLISLTCTHRDLFKVYLWQRNKKKNQQVKDPNSRLGVPKQPRHAEPIIGVQKNDRMRWCIVIK